MNLDVLQKEVLTMLANARVLFLASVNQFSLPEASSVPFLFLDDRFWIFVSRLSDHTQNLSQSNVASLMLLKNLDNESDPFTIERIGFSCLAEEVHQSKNEILDLMTKKLGDTVTLLRQLPDFHLFALQPESGRYIKGFGQTYRINCPTMVLEHVNPAKA